MCKKPPFFRVLWDFSCYMYVQSLYSLPYENIVSNDQVCCLLNFFQDKDIYWQDGRGIVELKTLSEQLNACDGCDSPLSLMNIEQERLHRFGSYLSIDRTTCNLLNTVVTNKTHPGRK